MFQTVTFSQSSYPSHLHQEVLILYVKTHIFTRQADRQTSRKKEHLMGLPRFHMQGVLVVAKARSHDLNPHHLCRERKPNHLNHHQHIPEYWSQERRQVWNKPGHSDIHCEYPNQELTFRLNIKIYEAQNCVYERSTTDLCACEGLNYLKKNHSLAFYIKICFIFL